MRNQWRKSAIFAGTSFKLFVKVLDTPLNNMYVKTICETSWFHLQILGDKSFVMICAIWYHLYNLKTVKKHSRWNVTSAKSDTPPGCFSCF